MEEKQRILAKQAMTADPTRSAQPSTEWALLKLAQIADLQDLELNRWLFGGPLVFKMVCNTVNVDTPTSEARVSSFSSDPVYYYALKNKFLLLKVSKVGSYCLQFKLFSSQAGGR